MDYFTVFSLEKRFNIDIKALKKEYLLQQIKHHPDKAANDEERIKFLNLSMELNEAYKILQDDLLRAEYLLKLENIDLTDEHRKAKINQEILLKALEDRELLEELSNTSELKGFQEIKAKYKQDLLLKLSKAFQEKNLLKATSYTIELKYIVKLIEEIKNKISKINAAS
ncbi:MAG: hscB [Rickettsiaceae bacterium]|jgi:molecular chaperone HscB|nr:hscB [Rickettsiaceae bacterium]